MRGGGDRRGDGAGAGVKRNALASEVASVCGRIAMEANQLQAVIEKGFKDLRAELDEKFGKIDEEFRKVNTEIAGVRKDLKEVGDDARGAHVSVENLRHDLSIFDEGESAPLEKRVSALEVRVTKLERKRPPKK